jgi:hypothetical protein
MRCIIGCHRGGVEGDGGIAALAHRQPSWERVVPNHRPPSWGEEVGGRCGASSVAIVEGGGGGAGFSAAVVGAGCGDTPCHGSYAGLIRQPSWEMGVPHLCIFRCRHRVLHHATVTRASAS